MSRVLFLFVDGIGLTSASDHNPFSVHPTPSLSALLGGPLTLERVTRREGLTLLPLDATLGVPGLPQSATGQTALLTGVNAARALGRHVTAFPGPRLRAILEEHSLLRRLVRAGRRATFANPFGPRYFELLERRRLRRSATVCAVEAAELPLRSVEDLRHDRAVSWDILRDRFATLHDPELVRVSAPAAGRHLARLARDHDLTLFETFLTDLAGHRRLELPVSEVLARLDGLVEGVLDALGPESTLVLASDHGNLEDTSHTRHTLHPVPLLAVGPGARRLAHLSSILEVTPAILELLGVEEGSG